MGTVNLSSVTYEANQISWLSILTIVSFVFGSWSSTKLTRQEREDYEDTRRHIPGAPPPWVFFPIWTLLYGLIIFAWFVWWRHFSYRENFDAVNILFFCTVILIKSWFPLFFEARKYAIAQFVALGLLTMGLILIVFIQQAGSNVYCALIPFVIWNLFANYLNYQYWTLKMVPVFHAATELDH